MADSLRHRTIKGVGWSTIDTISKYGIEFIVSVVLARLLSPEEYGLIGIINIFIIVFNAIVDGGFSTALIRKKDATDDDFCTVFYGNLVVSFVLSIILFLGAPAISSFFVRPELTPLTRAMSSLVLINAFALVQKVNLTKKIDFKTQTKISIIASVTSGIIGILFAALNFGVWALVFQQISRQIVNTILLWFFNRWLPRLVFSWESFKSLFSFGWKLLVANLISVGWTELYNLVIGKCYSPSTLGQYTRAKQFGSVFSSNIGSVVQRVSLPVLSEIQEDKGRLKQAYRRIIKISMFVSLIFMMGLAAVAKPMVLVLIGEQWLPCVPMLQILCFNLVMNPLHMLNINLLSVEGRSDIQLVLQIIKLCLAVGPLLLGIYLGIYWMLIGSVIIGFIDFFLNSYYSGKDINYSSWEQLKDISQSTLVAFLMAIPVWLLSFINASPFIILPIQLIVGACITIAVCEFLQHQEYLELKQILFSVVQRNRD